MVGLVLASESHPKTGPGFEKHPFESWDLSFGAGFGAPTKKSLGCALVIRNGLWHTNRLQGSIFPCGEACIWCNMATAKLAHWTVESMQKALGVCALPKTIAGMAVCLTGKAPGSQLSIKCYLPRPRCLEDLEVSGGWDSWAALA